MRKRVHNYTSNLELTSLLIRIKNMRNHLECKNAEQFNRMLDKYINWHIALIEKRYGVSDDLEVQDEEHELNSRKREILHRIKQRIIRLSEITPANKESYNRFGQIILLMIKHILTKPQFSGYSYKDDFYSDAVYKILKYLGNFDHTLISERTGQPVNAFSYISQIIHNSILYIINTRKKEQDLAKEQAKFNVQVENSNIKNGLKNNLYINDSAKEPEPEKISKVLYINDVSNVIGLVKEALENLDENVEKLTIMFPKHLELDAEQYYKLKEIQKNSKNILDFGSRF